MPVLLGEVFEAQTNAIEAAKMLATHAELGDLPFDAELIQSIVKALNSKDDGCSVNGAKHVYVHTLEAYRLPEHVADIEFISDDVVLGLKMEPGWYAGHLHGIEWIGSSAVSGFGARMFNVVPVYADEPVAHETAFVPVQAIETVLAAT